MLPFREAEALMKTRVEAAAALAFVLLSIGAQLGINKQKSNYQNQ
jgi:regulator of sirC expression with transglutaminase-like and TPR domain